MENYEFKPALLRLKLTLSRMQHMAEGLGKNMHCKRLSLDPKGRKGTFRWLTRVYFLCYISQKRIYIVLCFLFLFLLLLFCFFFVFFVLFFIHFLFSFFFLFFFCCWVLVDQANSHLFTNKTSFHLSPKSGNCFFSYLKLQLTFFLNSLSLTWLPRATERVLMLFPKPQAHLNGDWTFNLSLSIISSSFRLFPSQYAGCFRKGLKLKDYALVKCMLKH